MHITVNLKISNTKQGNYSYSVNQYQYDELLIGSQVIVNMQNQLKLATVISKSLVTDFAYKLKPITMIYNYKPLNEYQSKIASAIIKNSFASHIDIQNLFVTKVNDKWIDIEYLDEEAKVVGSFRKKTKKTSEIVDKRVKINLKEANQTYKYIELAEARDYKLTEKQQQVYDYVTTKDCVSISKTIEETGVSRDVINRMIKNELLVCVEKTKQFETVFSLDWHKQNKLSSSQQFASLSLDGNTNLLHGVSGSGKTEVYIDQVKKALKAGKQALVVVPSVMLAIQVVGKFQKLFDDIIIYHNKLTESEKYSYNLQIKNNQKQVVISTFKGLFLPFDNLGLVIFDEAHSTNYNLRRQININKQVIVDSLNDQGIKVILGSATPLINDYAMTKYKGVNLVTLSERYGRARLPDVNFVKSDTSEEELEKLITRNKTRNKPTIIFFNKVGYSRQVFCNDCYNVHVCPNCNQPLTYFAKTKTLKCKYDGYTHRFDNNCLRCNSSNIKYIGEGIEQFTQTLTNKYPEQTIKAIDSSLTTDELHEIMIEFGNGDIDILIGTQVIAYGIDFLNVDTIYIKNIDNLLLQNEFNSHEKTYNILEQVAGRVGRSEVFSEAIIETDFEEHFVMQAVKNHDYLSYFNQELQLRRIGQISPYFRLCKIELLDSNEIKLNNIAEQLRDQLLKSDTNGVSLVQKPYINYRFQKHRAYIMVKYKHQNMKEILYRCLKVVINNNIDYIIDLNNNEIGV